MKLCPTCVKQHGEMLKELLKVKITESKLEECEFGHPKFRPQLPKELAERTKELREKTKHTKSSSSTDPEGLVYFYPSYGGVWYWWLACQGSPSYICYPWQPSDTEKCDIHYEPWIYIDALGGWYGGLVDFGGCNPATNCGGNCGQVNSKRNGVCLRRYSEAPEVFRDGWLWCSYGATGIQECIPWRTQYMILNYTP